MADRTFIYIDGESHFIRSETEWKEIHGKCASLDELRVVDDPEGKTVFSDKKAKVFWTKTLNPGAHRTSYFTSFAGNEQALHQLKCNLRDFELVPWICQESKTLHDTRANKLRQNGLIEKAKQVDIELAVQLLIDGLSKRFEICHLYTSDVDFVPVIKAVQHEGFPVYVHGYRNGLGENSELLHVPDKFYDLGELLRKDFVKMGADL